MSRETGRREGNETAVWVVCATAIALAIVLFATAREDSTLAGYRNTLIFGAIFIPTLSYILLRGFFKLRAESRRSDTVEHGHGPSRRSGIPR